MQCKQGKYKLRRNCKQEYITTPENNCMNSFWHILHLNKKIYLILFTFYTEKKHKFQEKS